MTTRTTEPAQGDGGNPTAPPGPPGPPDQRSRVGNKIYKSGPLFIASKGIGWTSWKKRWFILTRTSLVFFRSDPSAIPQKGSEVNLTLGGIDLNNSGSVVVKADKKLLTVLFPDGRDGRAFTLKAETSEDLYEWKTALEEALAQAPSAALVMGQNGIFRNNQADAVDGSFEQVKDRLPVKSLVIGRPILLALEDIDGTPSFLEKALRFIEEHGVKVEGILRQAAAVDDVERRVREYEQGKNEFSPDEDPHIVADCVKFVLRELPSSPVPASCCNALLEACRTDRGMRVTAMRSAICETFPEPNRRLLQRILMMMQTVASHKSENRMSTSAVAACMAPLLLRPLLAGDCELENDFDVGGDGSVQLLQAAAAANHAQAIIITLLEEYDNLFGEGSLSPELYSDSEESGSESEELTDDDDGTFEDDDATEGSDADVDEDFEHASNGTCSEASDAGDNDKYDDKGSEGSRSGSTSLEVDDHLEANQQLLPCSPQTLLPQHDNVQGSEDFLKQVNNRSEVQTNESDELLGDEPAETSSVQQLIDKNPSIQNSATLSNGPVRSTQHPIALGRTPAKKKLSMESIDLPTDDEAEIQRLKVTKTDLQNRIAEEAKGNAVLQKSLERRKKALHERRVTLEQDVARLQDQLQKERELRTLLEAGLKMPQHSLPISSTTDEKIKAELDEIAQVEVDVINLKLKADDLGVQLNQQREQNYGFVHDSCNQTQQTPNYQTKLKQKDVETTSASHIVERSTRSKDNHLDTSESDKVMKQEPPSLPNRHPPQNQQPDPMRNSKSSGAPATYEPATGRPSKKSGAKGEGATTTSALSKLTTRLNFLKERRNQITNELQNMDKGRSSGQSVQNLERGKNLDKYPGSGGQSSEKGRGTDSYQSLQNPDKRLTAEGQLVQNMEKLRKSDGQSLQNLDKGTRSESLSVPNLDKGKSESFPNGSKGQGSEDQSVVPPRTYSR
ncbi:hypothetical protein F0562_027775 [Nyssa sinensis]|uniref:Rho-GAP domain-containing protein n=1 Tax=Nyssa sinensis TaxID=561372 RepID=A0A5J5B8U7_9ASTE|nr:hypothetical protein F0562_027775 [Nyssa sinensis]